MRRQEIIEATQQVSNMIKLSKLDDLLGSVLRQLRSRPEQGLQASPLVERTLASYQKYLRSKEQFTEAAWQIMDIFDLKTLEDPKFWSALLQSGQSSEISPRGRREELMTIHRMGDKIAFASRFLPPVARMLEQESIRAYRDIKRKSENVNHNKELLALTLLEEPGKPSRPERVIRALEAINDIYVSCATLNGCQSNDLTIIACDSGSDKSFDFLGAAKIIESVKEIILALWDRVIFFRERQFEERVGIIAKSLPIIEQVNGMVESNKLDPEKAELIRRGIIDGASKFLNAGATIPELQVKTFFEPRELLAPEPRLLTGLPQPDGPDPDEKLCSEDNQKDFFMNENISEDVDGIGAEENYPFLDELSFEERKNLLRKLRDQFDSSDSEP